MSRVLLEVIVSSLDDARAARDGGADRFELCSALALGGLTPSLGTLDAIKAEMDVPAMFMVRPREGGMAYTDAETEVMLRDARLALRHGANGLVFGFLTSDGRVDGERCRQLLDLCGEFGAQGVFHRAFDVVADPVASLEVLVELGFTRVLTSGGAARATDGLPAIRRTVDQAAGRLQVLPGGGIRAETVAEVVRATRAGQVRLSISRGAPDLSASRNPQVRFGVDTPPTELEYRAVDPNGVRRVRDILDGKNGA